MGLELTGVQKVIDIGTGTGIWAMYVQPSPCSGPHGTNLNL